MGICSPLGISASGATGDVQVTGTRSFSNRGSYTYGNAGDQITGSGLPSPVLAVGKQNAGTLRFSQNVNVLGRLGVYDMGNIDTNGQTVTLVSNAMETAMVAHIGTGAVVGNLTAQRYIDDSMNPGLGYRHLVAPVSGPTVASFGTGGTPMVVNSAYNTSTAPGQVTPFPTVFRYNQARLTTSPATSVSAFDKGWESPASLSEPALLAMGHTVQLAGGTTLSFTGTVANGTQTIPLTRNVGATAAESGWNFIGNPYASPLRLNTITAGQRTNMDAAFYVYESTSRYGGSYRSYVNGVGNPNIGMGQAFFVRVSDGQTSGSLTLDNTNRESSGVNQPPVRRDAPDQRPQLQLTLAGNGLRDVLTLYAQPGASPAFDREYDAVKRPNPNGLNLASLTTAGQQLAIDGRPAFTQVTAIPLLVEVPAAGRYTLSASELANLPAGTRAELVDNLTSTRTALTSGTSYLFTLAGTTAPGRFWVSLTPAAAPLATSLALAAQVIAYPNPAHGQLTVLRPQGSVATAAVLLNSLGQTVRLLALPTAETRVDLSGLAAGVYTLRMTIDGQPVAKRVVLE
ncbi:T9SS type A sorting domain-containing protein [Hymenobacter saemangeumensis]|uniref:T9SS type A sorting domain-containing protein n=1 Tax=Hymenobacter saemangeumensis TaxID=1084522 RepID=UPI0031EBEE1B